MEVLKLTVTTTTLGRKTLAATLDSVPSGVGVEYHLVVDPRGDVNGAWKMWSASDHCIVGKFSVSTIEHARQMKWGERDLLRPAAKGKFLCWMDDDDVYVQNAFENLLPCLDYGGANDMHFFKAEWPRQEMVLWKEPQIDYENMAVPIIVVPNIPKIPLWTPAGAESYYFAAAAEKVVRKAGGKVWWHDEIIARIRPHDARWK